MFHHLHVKFLSGCAALALCTAACSGVASAQDHSQHMKGMSRFVIDPITQEAAILGGVAPQLWDNLGTLDYPITANADAQRFFDQGLRLTYAFNHAEAQRAFHRAQELDPSCAMCFWGEALVLGPNINAPMAPDANKPALEALAKAQAVGTGSEKEKALIAALATRYSLDPNADRLKLDAAFGDAMAKLAETYPDDAEINTIAAEALMDTQAWDYWTVSESGAKVPKGRAAEINMMLERALKSNPNHPGASHYYIHLMEASDTPELAVPHADRLAALMPGAGHLVHMPSHVYYRVGRYVDSLKANEAAVMADEQFLSVVPDKGIYAGGYYPHNVHFVLVSAQMAGDGKTAIAAAEKLSKIIPDEILATVAWTQPVEAAPFFAHAQYSTPETILAVADPGDKFPYVKAGWHYMRGIAFARKGDIAAAQAEVDALDAITNKSDLSFLISNYVPADQLLQIARHVMLGRIAQQKGYANTAIDEFQRAVSLQDGLPYMEPPYWYYPVRQTLGASLLNAGRTEEAAEVFKAGLKEAANNGWILYGLQQAQIKLGDVAAAKESEAAVAKAWIGPRELLDLNNL